MSASSGDSGGKRRDTPHLICRPNLVLLCEACVLNLTGVRFIDSTGVGLLVRLKNQLRRAGHHLILVAPSVRVLRALRLLRLEAFFQMATDAVEARAIIARRDQEQLTLVVVSGATRPLAWQGEITAENAERIWSLTEERINRFCAQRRKISIDLPDVRFVDSTGLGVMVRVKEFAERLGGSSPKRAPATMA